MYAALEAPPHLLMIPPDTEFLLTQDDWLRRIARQLVSDPDLADDLVQDAWVAGLERGRTDVASRPWLRGVLRNSGLAFFRASDRRRTRERRAAAAEALPSTDEVVAQLQLRERVSHEMLSLEEPFRTALYLTFVAGVPQREAARRMDVAPSTANDRVQEGLARLRKRIDRAYDGDRGAWVTALNPLVRPRGLAALSAGGFSMLVVASLLVGAVAFVPGLVRGGASSTPAVVTPSNGASVAVTGESAEPGTAPVELAAIPIAEAARDALVEASPVHTVAPLATEPQEPEAGVSGRFLLPNGSPAAGATWTIHGFGANRARRREYGMPEDWIDPSGVLDADGRIDARFDSPQALQFTVTVEMGDHVRERWRWGQIGPKEVKDLGTVTLRPGGTVTGRIVDSNGQPLVGKRWRVYGDQITRRAGLGRSPAREIATADEATATFTLSRLPAGGVTLKVKGKQIGWSKEHPVTVIAGQTVTKDILLDEVEAFADRIVLTVFHGPYHSAPDPSPDRMWLVEPNGTRRHAFHVPSTSQNYAFDDVGGGVFRVEIDDPRYLPWSEDGVVVGAVLRPQLRGSAGVTLDVRSSSGAPVALYSVDVKFENVSFSPNRFRPVKGTTPLVNGLLDGLVPADYTITVRSQEGVGSARVDALVAGETRALAIALQEASVAAGIVRHPGGEPASGVLVRLVTPAEVNDSPTSMIFSPTTISSVHENARHEIVKTLTDEDGAFELTVEAPGPHIVIAGVDGAPRAETAVFDTGAGSAPADLALTLDRGGVLEGQILFPAGLETTGRQILFVRPGSPSGPTAWMGSSSRVMIRNDGRFTLGPLMAGQVDLYLYSGGGISFSNGVPSGCLALGGIVLLEGETITSTFDYPGGLPVEITLDLTPSSLGAGTVTAFVTRAANRAAVATKSSNTAIVGPIVLEADTYNVWFGGSGWIATHSGLTVVEGEARTVAIELGLETRRVQFTRGGAPLANTGIQIRGAPQTFDGRRFQTDAHGRVELRLGAGAYSFHILSMDHEIMLLDASATWPMPSGVEEIVFE